MACAFLKGPAHIAHALLIPVQCNDGSCLRNRCGVGSALRLHVFHRADQRRRTTGVTNPPAGHRVGLGNPVQHNGAGHQIGRDIKNIHELGTAKQDMLIHIVGSDNDIRVLAQNVGQGRQFVGRVSGTGRVGRAVEEQ